MNKAEKSMFFFNSTKIYLKSNPIVDLRKSIVAEILGEVSNKQIIDIGCGNGEVTKDYLVCNKVTFLDFSTNMLALAKENINDDYSANSTFINTDFSHFTTDNKYDIVVCLGVIAHVDNIGEFLYKLKEITADGGVILFQYTASEKLISKFNQLRHGLLSKTKYNYDYKINSTSSRFIKKLIDQTGLNLTKKVKYFPVSPLFSVFNYETKIKLLKFTYKSRLFSFLGSEIILSLSKTPITKKNK